MSGIRKSIAVLLLAFWASSVAFGHDSGIVRGQVTDGRTGAPLAAVHVGLVGTQLSARTGQDGRFSIPNVRPGHYELRATLIGYGAGTALVSVQAGQTAMTNIRLTTSAMGLQAIMAGAHGNGEHGDGTDVPGIGETTAGFDDRAVNLTVPVNERAHPNSERCTDREARDLS